MCVSWPQACILPGCVLLYSTFTSSCGEAVADPGIKHMIRTAPVIHACNSSPGCVRGRAHVCLTTDQAQNQS